MSLKIGVVNLTWVALKFNSEVTLGARKLKMAPLKEKSVQFIIKILKSPHFKNLLLDLDETLKNKI